MRTVKISDIAYCEETDETDLPQELNMTVSDEATIEQINDLAENYITEVTGWLHEGFAWCFLKSE